MTLYVTSSFSLNMLEIEKVLCKWVHLYIDKISPWKAKEMIEKSRDVVFAIGHESTAKLLSQLLGMEIKAERKVIKLKHGDKLIIVQLIIRPPEGKVYTFHELLDLLSKNKLIILYVEYSEVYVS